MIRVVQIVKDRYDGLRGERNHPAGAVGAMVPLSLCGGGAP